MSYAALGVAGLVLMFFGARHAKREYDLGKPARMWVPLPLRENISMAEQERLAEEIGEKLRSDEILRQVVVDVGLQEKFGQPTEDAAMKELGRRMFVEAAAAASPSGLEAPSINVGVSGTGHERAVLGEASMGLIKHVRSFSAPNPVNKRRAGKGAPPLPGSH